MTVYEPRMRSRLVPWQDVAACAFSEIHCETIKSEKKHFSLTKLVVLAYRSAPRTMHEEKAEIVGNHTLIESSCWRNSSGFSSSVQPYQMERGGCCALAYAMMF